MKPVNMKDPHDFDLPPHTSVQIIGQGYVVHYKDQAIHTTNADEVVRMALKMIEIERQMCPGCE